MRSLDGKLFLQSRRSILRLSEFRSEVLGKTELPSVGRKLRNIQRVGCASLTVNLPSVACSRFVAAQHIRWFRGTAAKGRSIVDSKRARHYSYAKRNRVFLPLAQYWLTV